MNRPLGHGLPSPARQIALSAALSVAIGMAWASLDDSFGKTALMLLVAPFVAVFLPLINTPFQLVLGFVTLSLFRLPEVFLQLHGFHLPELFALGALLALAWHLFGTRTIRPFWPPELVLFMVFSVAVTFSVVFSVNREISFAYWSGIFVKICVMTLAISWLPVDRRGLSQAAHVFLSAGAAVGTVAIFNWSHGIGLVEGTRVTIGRDTGSVLGDPNDLALVLLFPVGFALGLALTRGVALASRLAGAAGLVILIPAIIATQSRGGLLGLAVAIIPFVRRRFRSRLLIWGIVGAGAVTLFIVAGISERSVVVEAGEGLDASAQGRIAAWEAAVRMALAHPLTGVGLDTFGYMYYSFTDDWQGRALAAHSIWFQALGETGFPAFLALVGLVGLSAGRLLRLSHSLDDTADPVLRAVVSSLLSALAGFVVAGTFLSQAFNWPIYLLLSLSIATHRYASAPPQPDAARRLRSPHMPDVV